MAVAAPDIHFVQACDGPAFAGPGDGALCCGCGRALVQGYQPALFLGVAIQCGSCGAVTVTPPLAEGAPLPVAVFVALPTAQVVTATATVLAGQSVVGQAEAGRIAERCRPVTPGSNVYAVTGGWLDAVEATYLLHSGRALPVVGGEGFAGLTVHALGWAVGHLRGVVARDAGLGLANDATAAACCTVAGFMHFVATWSRHPLFPAMAATAGARGFCLHGLAQFAAAHMLAVQGNAIDFRLAPGDPSRIGGMALATGPEGRAAVRFVAFDRFEHPFGKAWTEASLRSAVEAEVAAAQGELNRRNAGLLVLSPGIALTGFDEALILAVQAAVRDLGRRNRGLMAVAPIVLRLLPGLEAGTVEFGYGFFPVPNRHYRGGIGLG